MGVCHSSVHHLDHDFHQFEKTFDVFSPFDQLSGHHSICFHPDSCLSSFDVARSGYRNSILSDTYLGRNSQTAGLVVCRRTLFSFHRFDSGHFDIDGQMQQGKQSFHQVRTKQSSTRFKLLILFIFLIHSRDALFVCLLNVFTIFLIGFIVFSTLGHLSQERNLDITKVVLNGKSSSSIGLNPFDGPFLMTFPAFPSGPSVAFVVFSEFLMTMPFPTLWGAAFFLLLFFVGTDYQIGVAVTLLTTIEDLWGSVIRRNFFSKQLFILLVCSSLLVLNSFFITQVCLDFIFFPSLIDRFKFRFSCRKHCF